MQILKTSMKHNTVTFVALTPDEVDRNGDIISEDEIIKTAHEFMSNLNTKSVNIDHKEGTDIKKSEAFFVESYVLPVDLVIASETIVKGSWLVGIKFSDGMFERVLAWDFVWISIEGTAKVEPK